MASQKQIEANRRNAARSTGPKTEAGKQRSSMNALRHALTGQVSIMNEHDRIAHDKFCKELIGSMQPEGALELQFAQSVAEDSWRLNRARSLEEGIFALGQFRANAPESGHPQADAALAAAQTFLDEAHRFQLLTLYEQRINRSLQKNLQQLRNLQAERTALIQKEKAARAKEMEEAKLLAQVSLMNGLAYDPAKDGFVFSNGDERTGQHSAAVVRASNNDNLAIDRDSGLNAAIEQSSRTKVTAFPAGAVGSLRKNGNAA